MAKKHYAMMIHFTLNKTLLDLKLTSAKFSELSGVRKNTILDMRNGDTTRIHIDALEKILEALNKYDPTRSYDISDIFVYKVGVK